jgi:hypothetical protein
MIPISEVEICNLALAHLGEAPIVTLLDANERARSLNRIFIMTRDAVLRGKDWKFAKVKAVLAEISGVTIPGWTYVYGYPTKCLCVRRIFTDIESQEPLKVEYETLYVPSLSRKVIVANEETAYVAYTYQIENVELFDNSFIMALSFLLASQVAKPLTANDDTAKLMLQIYGSLIGDAARINDSECYKKPVESSSIEDSRG